MITPFAIQRPRATGPQAALERRKQWSNPSSDHFWQRLLNQPL